MVGTIGLDFETYGAVSLPDHGLFRYVGDKSFTPLLACIAERDTRGFVTRQVIDFTNRSLEQAKHELDVAIGDNTIAAHNAGFEAAVLDWLGFTFPASRFRDSAVVARAAGAGSGLEAAAPQLLDADKLASGKHLIKLFCIPGQYQEDSGSPLFDPQIVRDHQADWLEFIEYCCVDAELGLAIVDNYSHYLTPREWNHEQLTFEMNRVGWPVDVEMVEEMQRRYLENQAVALAEFRRDTVSPDLNLNSLKQMKEWCEARGIKATSFDEKHVERLIKRIRKKLEADDRGEITLPGHRYMEYCQVLQLCETKQILGGSSLKKLQVILDTQVDGRLKDQYLHCGAGQTLRTTGRSVQMQNLKRLDTEEVAVMEELNDPSIEWDNPKLATNIRQVFTSSKPDGRLIVGDFGSVESRGLAYLAGETWKLDAYRRGEPIYKLLATEFFGCTLAEVTHDQRQAGKVGELSCGYGAAGEAVQSFAAGMGIELTEGEATKIVWDWRDANPATIIFWSRLDDMLHRAVEGSDEVMNLTGGLVLRFLPVSTPTSLLKQVGGSGIHGPEIQSVEMRLDHVSHGCVLKRYFHGCHVVGRNVRYFRASNRKTGDLWNATFMNPKTKHEQFYELYGGKLAGILTQSFCRELFMHSLRQVSVWANYHPDQLALIGQFHDEIVVDWWKNEPYQFALETAQWKLGELMSQAPVWAPDFPLVAEVKSDYRYIK